LLIADAGDGSSAVAIRVGVGGLDDDLEHDEVVVGEGNRDVRNDGSANRGSGIGRTGGDESCDI
jgi:hypothetical protein